MITNPIIPIWLMAIICVIMLVVKRKGIIPYIRQIVIVLLVFAVNLRVMVPSGDAKGKTRKIEANVVIVVDSTISMLARDYNGETERLTAVKADCKYVTDELYGARFSVISFDNIANYLSPFTNDAGYTANVIDAISPIGQMYAKGSSINVCKDMLNDILKKAKDKDNGNVYLLFISDGEITNGDKLDSFKGLSKYIDGGAVLGYGTKEGGEMYARSYSDEEPSVVEDKSDYPYKPAISRIDENNLKKLAGDMGIDYINMNKQSNIDSVLDEIRRNSSPQDTENSTYGYKDVYYIFLIPLLLLLIFEFICYKRRK